MCIIVAKEIGYALPKKAILEQCFKRNPHGAGFMYNHNNKVWVEKGFMDFNSFYERLCLLDSEVDFSNKGLVMHFRISTSGKIDGGNCHPYPIDLDKNELRDTIFNDDNIAMVHNGIIRQYNGIDKLYNDTQLFIQKVVSVIYKHDTSFYKKNEWKHILEELAKSKLCFLNSKGQIYTMSGNSDYIIDNGIIYSNDSYKIPKELNLFNYRNTEQMCLDDDELLLQCTLPYTEEEWQYLFDEGMLEPLDEDEECCGSDELVFYKNTCNNFYLDIDMNLYQTNEEERMLSLIEREVIMITS